MISTEVNRVKYVAEDFATYRQEADDFFKNNYPEDFNNTIATDIGNAMLDQLAFAMMSLSFSLNRKASELFLDTARLNKSIVKLAKMLGYPIKPGSPATADLTVSLTSGPYAFPVTIPVGFAFNATGGLTYEYRGSVDIVIPPGSTTATFPVKEGVFRRVSFVSDGTENQQFSVYGVPSAQFMYSDGMFVTVDGTEWIRRDLLKYETMNTYEVLFTDSPPKLRFGDGIAGNVPLAGSQIVLGYRYGYGKTGAVGKSQITSVVSPLVVNNIAIPLSLTNPVSGVGENPEDIRHVKTFASTFFRTQNAAVVKDDYDVIAGLQTGVSLADAQVMRGIATDLTIQSALSGVSSGVSLMSSAVSGMNSTSVSGIGSLFVGAVSGLSVSGISYLGSTVSGGSVSGTEFLGVQGISGLFVGGTGSLGVTSGSAFTAEAVSGVSLVSASVSGLAAYLSRVFSDTSKANNVQIVVLSADSNNRYIAPASGVLTTVQSVVQGISDASVTVTAVDGSSNIVEAGVSVEIGISETAVKGDVESVSLKSLTSGTSPFGLLVKRGAGVSLYISDIEDAVRAANATGDIRFINVVITGPAQYLDANGNLVISKQQIIQNGTVTCKVIKRFLSNGDVINA